MPSAWPRHRPQRPGRLDLHAPRRRQAVRGLDGDPMCSRARCSSICSSRKAGVDFGRELIPAALDKAPRGRAPAQGVLGRCRHGRVVLRRQHHAHAARRALQLRQATTGGPSTRTRGSCRRRASPAPRWTGRLRAEGCYIDRADLQEAGHRHPHHDAGTSIRRSVLLGADTYDAPTHGHPSGVGLGIGSGVELDR